MIFEKDEQIINQFMPLIISNIKLYANYPHLYEDLIEDGKEEILRALKEFDEEDGAKLPWFLKVRLRTFFRTNKNTKKEECTATSTSNRAATIHMSRKNKKYSSNNS